MDFRKVRLTPDVKITPITIADVMIKATIDLRSTPRLLLYKRAKIIAKPAENPLAPKYPFNILGGRFPLLPVMVVL